MAIGYHKLVRVFNIKYELVQSRNHIILYKLALKKWLKIKRFTIYYATLLNFQIIVKH